MVQFGRQPANVTSIQAATNARGSSSLAPRISLRFCLKVYRKSFQVGRSLADPEETFDLPES